MRNSTANPEACLIHIVGAMNLYALLLNTALKLLICLPNALFVMCILTLSTERLLLAFEVFGMPLQEPCDPIFAKRWGRGVWI